MQSNAPSGGADRTQDRLRAKTGPLDVVLELAAIRLLSWVTSMATGFLAFSRQKLAIIPSTIRSLLLGSSWCIFNAVPLVLGLGGFRLLRLRRVRALGLFLGGPRRGRLPVPGRGRRVRLFHFAALSLKLLGSLPLLGE